MNQLGNRVKNLSESYHNLRGSVAGGSNIAGVMSVIGNLSNLGSNIANAQETESSETMTGQEMAKKVSKQNGAISQSVVSTLVAIAGTVLAACL